MVTESSLNAKSNIIIKVQTKNPKIRKHTDNKNRFYLNTILKTIFFNKLLNNFMQILRFI